MEAGDGLSATNKTLVALLCELAAATYCLLRAPAHAQPEPLRWALLAALSQ